MILINPYTHEELVQTDEWLLSPSGKKLFKKRGGAFIITNEEDNYTDSFGYQWNKFDKTQIDDPNLDFSKQRFLTVTGWDSEKLTGLNILEVGSGAGRFSKVILEETKANLYSIDYSEAVQANYRNNGHYGDRLKLFKASVYEMPFLNNSFDKVFCFGVLQHTPDFKKSVECLIDKVKPGGEVVVDFYPVTGWWTKINAKYLYRPYTKKMPREKLLRSIERNVNWLIRLYNFFDRIGIGKFVNRFLPICDIKGTLPANLPQKNLREWVILDTFDMFSPEHDNPQRISTVSKWFEEYGMNVTFSGFLIYANNLKVAVVKGVKKIK
jgi:SAM-dependent methyltransferase